MASSVERFRQAAAALDIGVEIRQFPEGTKTAADAAAAIGCDVGAIVKSLVFVAGEQPIMALVSGANQCDIDKLAAVLGVAGVRRANADEVRAATSYAIGGVPPFGHAVVMPIAIDEDLLAYDEVWAAAGTWNDNFAITPDDLVRAAGGVVADVKTA